MEPWISPPRLTGLTPGSEIYEQCELHVPDGKAFNVVWHLEYGPSWMQVNPLTGVISGKVPREWTDGKFNIRADFDYTPGRPAARARKPAKPAKPAKLIPPVHDAYTAHRDRFVNSPKLGGDWEAFDNMLSVVTMDLVHDMPHEAPRQTRRIHPVLLVALLPIAIVLGIMLGMVV